MGLKKKRNPATATPAPAAPPPHASASGLPKIGWTSRSTLPVYVIARNETIHGEIGICPQFFCRHRAQSHSLSSPFACTPSEKTPGLDTSFEHTQQSTSYPGAANLFPLASTDLKPARYRAWRMAKASDLKPKISVNSSSKRSSNFCTQANLSRVHGQGTKQSGSDPNSCDPNSC